MIVPINVDKNHWALGFVDFTEKIISYWDSLGGDHPKFKQWMQQYLKDEWKDKKGSEEFPYSFSFDDTTEVPHQTNSYDCGVFTCMFAECLTRGRGIDFDQDDISDCRFVIALQIARKSILIS